MKAAAAKARNFLGATSPNPCVGAAAIDSEGNILATAAHQAAGQPHAEVLLLEACRSQNIVSKIEALCITLEPCNHHGRTPPCTDLLIASGIKKIVIGTRDPNPNVTGGGIERLKAAGLDVLCGINEDECRWLIHAFTHHKTTGLPWLTVKRAFTSLGSMIPPPQQKTFSSPSSLTLAHNLRKKSDAILTGSGTILADTPLFTVRHVKDYPLKKRWLAILDRRQRVPESYLRMVTEHGLTPIIYNDFEAALVDLGQKGAQDVLIEAGPTLSNYVLQSNSWAMSVTIQQPSSLHQDDSDIISVEFKSSNLLWLPTSSFEWKTFLPE